MNCLRVQAFQAKVKVKVRVGVRVRGLPLMKLSSFVFYSCFLPVHLLAISTAGCHGATWLIGL